jgi:hypothetical protein
MANSNPKKHAAFAMNKKSSRYRRLEDRPACLPGNARSIIGPSPRKKDLGPSDRIIFL